MNHWLAFGTVWSFFVATSSVVFAIMSHRRQVNASIYLDLSRQLHELYRRMPQKSAYGSQEATAVDGVRSLVFDSLQLIRSGFTLAKTGYFGGPLWFALRNDAEKGLRKPAFRELWPSMKQEFESDESFIAYVDKVHSSRPT